ncbi:hypothetical protein ACFLSS_02675 [Bacteroidota bacterium]
MNIKNKYSVIIFLIIAVIFILHSIYLAAPAEDAFIGFRYAKNIVNGHGLVWNPGETPVEGYTNFLWILICSAGMVAGLDIILYSQFIGIICGILILLYSYQYSRKILLLNNSTALLPPTMLAVSGPLAVWASSGMETGLFSLLVLTATYYTAKYWTSQKLSFIVISNAICLMSTLTRPEGLGIFLLLFVFQTAAVLLRHERTHILQTVLTAFLVYIVPFLIYFLWRINYYGEWLPLTFYAKTGGTFLQWVRGIKYVFFFLFHFIIPLFPIVILFIWLKYDGIKRMFFSAFNFYKEKSNNFLVITLLAYLIIGFTLYIIFVGGDYMAMYRFFVPVLPLIYILFASVYHKLKHDSKPSAANKQLLFALILLSISGTFIQSTPLEKYLFKKPAITHGQYTGVLTERWNSNRLTLIGKFFNDYKMNEDESLSTDVIGAVSFYSNMKIYGWHGLDDPVIAKMKVDDMGTGFPGHEKSDLKYTLSKKPTYFMYLRELTERAGQFPEYAPEVDSILRKEYEQVSVWLEDKKNDESGYFTFLQRKYTPGRKEL